MNFINPVFKCPGGKSWAIDKIRELAPKKYNNYIEPFVGGGSVFLNVAEKGFVSDGNHDIANVWRIIKSHPEELMQALSELPISKEDYYHIRNEYGDTLAGIEKAARFIYLNKCGYNGLIRYNKSGKYNVPFGRHKNVVLFNKKDILAAHQKLQNFEIGSGDFSMTLLSAKRDDWVFIDSPYDETFSSYTSAGFDRADQMRLAFCIHGLNERGVKFLLTNSNTPLIRELYKGFKQIVVPTRYQIGAQKDSRKKTREELFILNY